MKGLKHRYTTGSNSRMDFAQIAKDVMYLKSVVNSEKKRFHITYTPTAGQPGVSVGQLNGASASGYFALDVTPNPAQGTTLSTRNGASIKLASSYVKFQVSHQSATVAPINMKIQFWLVKGTPVVAATALEEMYNRNTFILNAAATTTPVVDYNSDLDPDFFGKYKLLKTVKRKISPDQFSGQAMIVSMQVPMKYNRGQGHHIRYDDNSTTVANGQMIMTVLCDCGNISSATASTNLGVPVTAVSTGLYMNYDILHYFYDN